MGLRHLSRQDRSAFDYTVMRASDKYMDTMFKMAMQVEIKNDDVGVGKILMALLMLLKEVS